MAFLKHLQLAWLSVKVNFIPKVKATIGSIKRPRNVFQYVATVLVLPAIFVVDPDAGFISDLPWGATAVTSVLLILKCMLGLVLLHWARKCFFDYIDLGDIYTKVMNDPDSRGAGIFSLSVSVWALAAALIIQKAF